MVPEVFAKISLKAYIGGIGAPCSHMYQISDTLLS